MIVDANGNKTKNDNNKKKILEKTERKVTNIKILNDRRCAMNKEKEKENDEENRTNDNKD